MNFKQLYVRLNNVPALLIFSNSYEKAASCGTVLFYHGLWASKETNEKELFDIARQGYLAVGIDCAGHGERQEHNLRDCFSTEGAEKVLQRIIDDTINEIPGIIDELVRLGLADPQKIGICGISMGAYIAYGSVIKDKRIRVSTPILGSPVWKYGNGNSPYDHPEKFFPVALLAQNAGKDKSVKPEFARKFHEILVPFYKDAPDRLRYVEFPESEHFMREQDWKILWKNVLNWFNIHLSDRSDYFF